MVRVFWNRRERRVRAGWRLLAQTVAQLALLVLLAQLMWLVLDSVSGQASAPLGSRVDASGASQIPIVGLTLLSAVLSVWLVGRFLDRRLFSDFGFHLSAGWWLDFGFGLALGAVIMTGIFLVELAAGWIVVTDLFHGPAAGWSFPAAIMIPLLLFVFVGLQEELVYRGYWLHNLSEGLSFAPLGGRGGTLVAWLLTSVLFGVLHAANPNASLLSSANIALAGLLMGLGYILTGELALPIGLHIAWNFFQGNVYGLPVSGITFSEASFVAVQQRGPDLWTGGVFGPEGGLLVTIGSVAGVGLLLLWARFRAGDVAPARSLPEPPVGRAADRPADRDGQDTRAA